MSRHILETIVGAIVLIVAIYFFSSAYQKSGVNVGETYYPVKATFNDVTGIGIGSDVRIGGVKIGAVEALSLDKQTYQAVLTMSIEEDIKLPQDSSAAIIGESLLGGKFVSLSPGGSDTMLKAGGMIEYTQSSVSLEQLLGKFIFSGGGVGGDDKGQPQDSDGESGDDVELSLP